jgi:hypothetical protein
VTETFEPDCSYCENFVYVYEEFLSPSEPIIVKNYYSCRANVFEVAFTKGELKKYYADCTTRLKLTRSERADELLSEIEVVNIVFYQLLGERVDVIEVDKHTAANLASPCTTRADFFTKICFLYNVLDFKRSPLRKLLTTVNPNLAADPELKEKKGVKLLKQLLAEKGQSDNGALAFFEKIIAIRNKSYPAHKFDQEVSNILREIGLQYPVSGSEDWQRNWDTVLRRCVESFRSLRKALINIINIEKTKATK